MLLNLLLFLMAFSGAREVSFSWEPFENVLGYQIEVSENAKFDTEPKVKKVMKTPTLTVDLPMGTYYYRVRAIDQQKRPGHWSEPEKVIVTPYPPELTFPKNVVEFTYFEIPPPIEFTWKPTEGDPVYELFIYKTTGKKVFEKKTKDIKFLVSELTEGEYMWKVRTIYKNIYESPYCEPRRFLIEKKPLSEPKLISPIKNAIFPAYRPVDFKWEKDSSTHFTDIQVESIERKAKSKVVFTDQVSDANETTGAIEGDGKFQWFVTTKEGNKTKGLSSETETFELRKDLIAEDNFSLEFGYSPLSSTYDYIDNRGGSGTGSVKASSLLTNLRGGYFFSKEYGLRLNLRKGSLSANSDVPFHEWTIANSLRMGAPGFTQEFLIGYRQENIYEFLGNRYNLFSTNGALLGTIINVTVAKNWRARIMGNYYKPIAHTERLGELKADVYEGYLGAGWNPFYKFWVNYQFGYSKHILNFRPKGSPTTSKTDAAVIEPFFISISLEH